MRRASLVLSIILVTALLATPSGAITLGHPDGNAHPNVGALVGRFHGQLDWFCSGTLIAPRVFLTASHCTVGMDSRDIWVTFDPVFSPTGTLYHGTAHTNPRYASGGENDTYDVAVVVLDQAPGIAPASLPTAERFSRMKAAHQLKGATWTSVGYGGIVTGPGGQIAYDGVRRWSKSAHFLSLRRAWMQLSMNTARMDGGTCYGDSGGPNFLGDTDVIAGITVTGDSVCRATNVIYRMDSASARDFLGRYVDLP